MLRDIALSLEWRAWSAQGRKAPQTKKTPRAPVRARLPLLHFCPGGVGLDGATRGADVSLPVGFTLVVSAFALGRRPGEFA